MTSTLLLLAALAHIAGLARGFSGFGAALIFMPMASLLIGPKEAAVVLFLIDLVFGLPLGLNAMRKVKPTGTGLMLLGAVVTVPLGTYILTIMDPLILRWMIAALVFAMLVILASGWRYAGEPHNALTIAVGAISGLCSGIAQVGGPPVVAYYMGRKDAEPAQIRASIFLFFAGTSVFALVTYLVGGLITQSAIYISLFAGPAYGLGILIGSRLFGVASPETFRRVVLVLIAAGVVISLPVWG